MDRQALTDAIDDAAQRINFSGVVSVTGDDLRLQRAYGFANRANQIANRVTTRFGIASGTKFLTALAVGSLIDRGLLRIDAKVHDLVSFDLPCLGRDATVAHLLEHTSGIYDYYDEELVEDFDNFHVEIPWNLLTTPRDYLPLFRDREMKFAPGERFSYSNGGYILLGVLVEELTGRLFREIVADNVLAPACMDRSGFFALNQLPDDTALGYMELTDGSWQTNIYNLPRIGASDGGVFATADDIDRLWRAFANDAVVGPDTRRDFTTARHRLAETVSYGRGLYLWTALDEPGWLIVGSDAGVGFDSRHVPGRNLTATVVSNTTDGHVAVRDAVRQWLIAERRGRVTPD
ncbi:MAG: serine hydrolase domain-containing protein [Spirochaetota bacterium]